MTPEILALLLKFKEDKEFFIGTFFHDIERAYGEMIYSCIFDHRSSHMILSDKNQRPDSTDIISLIDKIPINIRSGFYRVTKDSIEFDNGSKIYIRPKNDKHIRGMSSKSAIVIGDISDELKAVLIPCIFMKIWQIKGENDDTTNRT